MGKGFRVIGSALLVALLLVGTVGCGSSSKASVEKNSATAVQKSDLDKQTASNFVNSVTPLLEAAEKLHKATRAAVNKFGYGELSVKQALEEVVKIENATTQLRDKLDSVPANGEMEEIKGDFSTSLYLKQQNIAKLKKILQEPDPKSSTLNKVLNELQASEGFLEKSKGRIQNLKQSIGS
ncbi:MAG: hypothetical protein M0021_07100 [Clostridia bacterium]|nr:hypothetical protein [Clostridia bacterium]